MRLRHFATHCTGYRIAGRCFAVLLLLAVLAGLPSVAEAQSGFTSELVLKDATPSADAAPYVYMTPDPGRTISYQALINRFNSGNRGAPVNDQVINLGSRGVPHWIVLVVRNDSKVTDWMLSFGRHFDGRTGILDDLLVYEHLTRTRYLDTLTSDKAQKAENGPAFGTFVPLRLGKDSRSVIVIYAVPQPGKLTTIVPQLITERAVLRNMSALLEPDRLVFGFFTFVIALLLGAALFGRMPGSLLMAGYFMIQFMLFSSQGGVIEGGNAWSNQSTGMLFAIAVLTGLLAARNMLDINSSSAIQNRIILAACLLILIFGFISSVLLPIGFPARLILLLAPIMLGILLMVLLGVTRTLQGRRMAWLFTLTWAMLLIGLTSTLLALLGYMPQASVWFTGYWYAVIGQGFATCAAITLRFISQEHERMADYNRAQEEEEALLALRKSKEAGENIRLRRLIEHERQVMNELREREVEQTEEMRVAKDMADEANRAKSAFLAVISHEIRTPMSGILGMVRLLLDSALSRQQLDYAQTIQDSGDAMLALLNDILDFEKIESGKMDLEQVDFDVHRIINGVVTLMSGHAASRGITLKAQLDPSVPRYVIGDPIRLRQVLLNLTGNAIKFTKEGGVTVNVRTDPTVDTRDGAVHRVRFAIEDTGIGIPKEAQKNLFNPFSQADSSISRKFGGSGLGLAISQRLIEAMGGRIHIDSVEGEGSTFFFTLILESGSQEAAEDKSTGRSALSPRAGKAMKILIVEDNEINQKLLKEFINRMGHQTVICGSGEDGLAAIQNSPFDMVLMDVELPGISGMGTTRAIRALIDRERAATPVVALTGNVRDDDIRACYAANMNAHLAKPVDPKRLKEVIDRIGEGKLDEPVVLLEPAAPEPAGQASARRLVDVLTVAPPAKAPLVEIEEADVFDSFALDDGGANEADGVFDDRMLAGIRGAMSGVELQSMLDGLMEKTDEIIGQLNQYDLAADMKDAAARVHELKGMAGNFGLTELSGIAARAEKAARENQGKQVAAEIEALPDAAQRARAVLKKWAGR